MKAETRALAVLVFVGLALALSLILSMIVQLQSPLLSVEVNKAGNAIEVIVENRGLRIVAIRVDAVLSNGSALPLSYDAVGPGEKKILRIPMQRLDVNDALVEGLRIISEDRVYLFVLSGQPLDRGS